MQLLMRRPEVEGFNFDRAAGQSLRFSFLAPLPSLGPDVPWREGSVVPPKDVNTLVENSDQKAS